MPRPATALFVLPALLPAAVAVRRVRPGPPATQAETDDAVTCSDSERYEKVGEDCYDPYGEITNSKCCHTFDQCREDVMALSLECAARIQTYMQVCELVNDVKPEGEDLKLVDNTRICSEHCQSQSEFFFQDPLRNLPELEQRCAQHVDLLRVAVRAVQSFDYEWATCRENSATEQQDQEISIGPLGADQKLGLSFQKDPLHTAQIRSPPPPVEKKPRKPRWGPVEITTVWTPPILNLKAAFEVLWTAIPVTYSQEFKIRGTMGAIQEELLLRPNLPISCPEEHAGKPVNLVVAKIQPKARDVYLKSFTGGFANIGGLGTFALTAPEFFSLGGNGMQLASALAANPTTVSFDQVVDYMMDHVHRSPKRSAKKLWRWLGSTRNEAFFTLGDPEKKGHVGQVVKFQCNPMTINGKEKFVATWVDGAEMHTIVTAKHVALLITSLA